MATTLFIALGIGFVIIIAIGGIVAYTTGLRKQDLALFQKLLRLHYSGQEKEFVEAMRIAPMTVREAVVEHIDTANLLELSLTMQILEQLKKEYGLNEKQADIFQKQALKPFGQGNDSEIKDPIVRRALMALRRWQKEREFQEE